MRALAWILAENVLALAYSDESEIADDFALAQLERIAHSLKSADAPALRRFLATLQEMVEEASMLGDEGRANRLASLPDQLGLSSHTFHYRAESLGSV